MNNISSQQIVSLAKKVSDLILSGDDKTAIQKLKSVLDIKCPFPKLDLIGKQIGEAGIIQTQKFFTA